MPTEIRAQRPLTRCQELTDGEIPLRFKAQIHHDDLGTVLHQRSVFRLVYATETQKGGR